MTPSPSKESWLVYNDRRSIKIDRAKLAGSCFYFERLLEGPFRESKQTKININLGDMFSFEAFDCLIKYANDGIFLRDPDQHNLHIEAIQLAILWGYDEFVRVVESHLIEQLSDEKANDLAGLASRHRPFLKRLQKACADFSRESPPDPAVLIGGRNM